MGVVLRLILVAALAGLAPGLLWLSTTRSDIPTPPASNPTLPTPAIPFAAAGPIGMSGCAAAACHGNPNPPSLTGVPDKDCWQGSAVHWLAADPHSRAYDALTSDLGKRIMAHLRKADQKLPESAANYDRCLACHTNPTLAEPHALGLSDANLSHLRSEGVGCEACHGNAGTWLTSHTVVTERYPPAGMTDLNDIAVRAKVCTGCHVGAPADGANGPVVRDMNHDMIAAGHPRLNFEFTEYQRRLPPHWFERDRNAPGRPARGVAFDLKTWLVGRVAVAEAACELLADRAGRAGASPWPEFAEFNCFACHHSLQPESWRQTSPDYYAGRKPGALPWQSIWPVTLPGVFGITVPDIPETLRAANAVSELQAKFGSARPPGAESVQSVARDAAGKLAAMRLQLSSRKDAPRLGPIFTTTMPYLDRLDWGDAGQLYLGLAALERGRRQSAYDKRFDTLRDHLLLPRPPDGTGSNSPNNYSPQQVQADFRGLIDAVAKNSNPSRPDPPK